MNGYPSRTFGVLGLSGASVFLLSLVVLQVVRTDVDWTTHYVSNFVNGPVGWLFVASALLHGLGNLFLGIGLGRSLGTIKPGVWASGLFVTAATGILVATLFPADPADSAATLIGVVHGTAVAASFVLELASLFLFAIAFAHARLWKPHSLASLSLAILAAAALSLFFLLLVLDLLPGLGERIALGAFVAWEVWASFRLIRLDRLDA